MSLIALLIHLLLPLYGGSLVGLTAGLFDKFGRGSLVQERADTLAYIELMMMMVMSFQSVRSTV